MTFAANPRMPCDAISIELALQPVFSFMLASLNQFGAPWVRMQSARAAAGTGSEYRGSNAAMQTLKPSALNGLQSVMSDTAPWEMIPLLYRSVDFRNRYSNLGSTTYCAIVKKHQRVHQRFPTAAFLWLGAPLGIKAESDKFECKSVMRAFFSSNSLRTGRLQAASIAARAVPNSPPCWSCTKRT